MQKIIDVYKSKDNQFINDLFEYNILFKKPTKENKLWFEGLYDCPYPIYMEDLSKELAKDLKNTLKRRKKDRKFDEKMSLQKQEKGYCDLDVWNLCSWFMETVPKMLQELRDGLHGYPVPITPNHSTKSIDCDEEKGFTEWQNTIDRMIFLLHEMNEDTCSMKNEYQDEIDNAQEEFNKKYGFFGEKLSDILETEEEKEKHKKSGSKRWYSFSDDPEHPEWKELRYKWLLQQQTIFQYRNECKTEFFNLFSKYFWDLWD